MGFSEQAQVILRTSSGNSILPARGVTAFYILKFMSQNRSDPNYSIGFTPNFLASHVQGIKSQTWSAMHEILENFEKKGYVQKLYDGITKQTRYKITDKGVAAYLRWEPVMSEWMDFEF